jgi:transketolase
MGVNMYRNNDLLKEAHAVRSAIIDALFKAGGGHYGGAMSVTDILLALYRGIIVPAQSAASRDRVILSKGHAAIALYAVLKHVGILHNIDLGRYGTFNGGLEGHPDMTVTAGVDFSTGSLGQGVAAGLGMAFACGPQSHIWVIVGDGECQEGQIWEAALIASRYSVSNLHVIIDNNGAQEVGWSYSPVVEQRPLVDIEAKWQSFGWVTATVDGHDYAALLESYHWAQSSRSPSLIVAKTTKGKGLLSAERDPAKFHCVTLTAEEHQMLMGELNAAEIRA